MKKRREDVSEETLLQEIELIKLEHSDKQEDIDFIIQEGMHLEDLFNEEE
jgi:hypothetical protein